MTMIYTASSVAGTMPSVVMQQWAEKKHKVLSHDSHNAVGTDIKLSDNHEN